MPNHTFPHGILPPPEPYARWKGEGDDPLVYLGWGERDFSREGIPIHSNPGWTYWVLCSGTVKICCAEGEQLFEAGEGVVCGPEYAFGFPRQEMGPADVLIWIWRDPPPEAFRGEWSRLSRFRFGKEDSVFLESLHRLIRMENVAPTTSRERLLAHSRGLVEELFARAANPSRGGDMHPEFEAARQWMLQHLGERPSMNALCRYLSVSTNTLYRIFVRAAGESPGAYFHRIKMDRAEQLLAVSGFPVKRVALELGYRHPHDFSRAYKKHFGISPGDGRTSAGRMG
jgi:AraC-like DNA-binding protein